MKKTALSLAVLLLMAPIMGCIESEPYVPTITLSISQVEFTLLGSEGDAMFELVFLVNKVTPRGERVPMDQVRLDIKSLNGTMLFEDLKPVPSFEGAGDGPVVVVLNGEGDTDILDVNDTFRLRGFGVHCLSATIQLKRVLDGQGRNMAYVLLPEHLVDIPVVQVTERDVNGTMVYDANLPIDDIEFEKGTVEWSDVTVELTTFFLPTTSRNMSLNPPDAPMVDDVQAWWVDLDPVKGFVDPSDAIRLTGLGEVHENACVDLYFRGNLLVSSVNLPQLFAGGA